MILTLSHVFFVLFAGIMVASALMVVVARNPVHSMLALLLCFFNAGGLFVLLGAEFLAMILVIVYGGAVAVLFLFVVMMLNINFEGLRTGAAKYLALGGGLMTILLAELLFFMHFMGEAYDKRVIVSDTVEKTIKFADNTRALGNALFTEYLFPFECVGLILFIATIGAIVLTHQDKIRARRQNIVKQIETDPASVIILKSVESGKGVTDL